MTALARLAALAALAALATLAQLSAVVAGSIPYPGWCEVPARTQAGWVCGTRLRTAAGVDYASFLAVPYAKQPLKELRFQELQPLEPWEGALNATAEGPVCPQKDVLYKSLMLRRGGMNESCIHANVHVPLLSLPSAAAGACVSDNPLPIFVFIHGGGFSFGSGDSDLHGPDYLINKDTIVVTFNYRLNILGFLSLNSSKVPGNAGLRDVVTLLRWVRANARCFGGDPAHVTIAGQSAGAVLAHLLTMIPAAEGLFHRVVSMSGVATSDFYSSSPQFMQTAAQILLSILNIDPAQDAHALYEQLATAPLDALMRANDVLIDLFSLVSFVPVVESPHPGVTPMLLEDPETLLKRGVGKDVPLLLGFTNKECELFRPRLQETNMIAKIKAKPSVMLPARPSYMAPPDRQDSLVQALHRRYMPRGPTEDGFVRYCTDAYYKFPAMRVAAQRAEIGGAPVSLYRFSYNGIHSATKEMLGLHFKGAGHIEDLTYIFRTYSFLGSARAGDSRGDDDRVVDLMTDIVVKYMNSPDALDAVGPVLQYLSVESPMPPLLREPTAQERDMLVFFENLYANATAPAQ